MASRKTNEIIPWVELALRLALGGWFAWSGWEKVFSVGLDEFTRTVGNYKFVYSPWDAVLAYTIPWVEMVVGLCLFLGLWKRGSLLALAGLVAVFAVGVGHAWSKGLNIACGCHGNADGSPMNYTWKFMEFGGYWLAILVIWWLGRRGSGHVFGGTKMKLPG